MEQHTDCSYCMCGTDNTLVDAFGIPMLDLPASKLILFKEQSHKGRVIVASKQHVDDISCMSEEDAAAFMADVRHVAAALHKAFNPDKINFGAYGDTMHHLHVHIVPKYKDDPFGVWRRVCHEPRSRHARVGSVRRDRPGNCRQPVSE